MKISQLIKTLEGLQASLGDVPVVIEERGYGGYAVHTCGAVNKSSIRTYDLGEDGYPDADTLKELFPQWDGQEDSFEELDAECICVEIQMKTCLYST